MKNRYVISAILILVILAGFFLFFEYRPVSPSGTLVAEASYSCDGEKTISAAFYRGLSVPSSVPGEPPQPNGSVELILTDGRRLNLPQTISADGGRYANVDESLVFWSKGYGAFITENGTMTYSNCLQVVPMRAFTNAVGGYSFEHPSFWEAAVNEYNGKNSLFGPDATSTSGLGGVEIFPNQKSITDFLGDVSAAYSDETAVTIDGVSGAKVEYRGSAQNGTQVVLFKDGTIYNLYIGSVQTDDVGYFLNLVSSFKFIP